MSQVLVIQHEDGEGPGLLGEVLQSRGHALQVVHPYRGDELPMALEADGLVILGGGLSANDTRTVPSLQHEIQLIEAALSCWRPILGICLGAQLLARALGARVWTQTQRELGWLPVRLLPDVVPGGIFDGAPQTFTAFHWHDDAFELPAGAALLAESDLCPHQAFRFDDFAWGIQWHPEVDEAVLEAMVKGGDDALRAAVLTDAKARLAEAQPVSRRLFERWAELLKK